VVRQAEGAERVYESWIYRKPFAVDDPCAGGHVNRRAGRFNESITDEHGAALDNGTADSNNAGIANRDGGGGRCGERRRTHEELRE
jgi:hypothetical protein